MDRAADATPATTLGDRFVDYLEAKFELDERSLNPDVRSACFERLAAGKPVRCLDVGAGTGAMVCRLVACGPKVPLSITVLERDAMLVERARETLTRELDRQGFVVRAEPQRLCAHDGGRTVEIAIAQCDLFEFDSAHAHRYDLVTAHAVMDLLPLPRALARFSRWLAKGGLLYATLSYDGDTALFPRYRDAAFEAAVLAAYDASMEHRCVAGEPTGGAHCGRRLHALLAGGDWECVAYGSADWNITPVARGYRGRDAHVLRALLTCIRDECERAPAVDRMRLATWYAERSAQLRNAELGMIVHQIDVLAARAQGLSAFT